MKNLISFRAIKTIYLIMFSVFQIDELRGSKWKKFLKAKNARDIQFWFSFEIKFSLELGKGLNTLELEMQIKFVLKVIYIKYHMFSFLKLGFLSSKLLGCIWRQHLSHFRYLNLHSIVYTASYHILCRFLKVYLETYNHRKIQYTTKRQIRTFINCESTAWYKIQ